MTKLGCRDFISAKYGNVHVVGVPHTRHHICVDTIQVNVEVLVKEVTSLSDAEIELIIEKTFARRKKYREFLKIKPASPEFTVNHLYFKMKLREAETEYGLLDYTKEGDWWVVLYPPGMDFSSDVAQERLFTFFDKYVFDAAVIEYLNKRGPEIASIIGTSIPRFTTGWYRDPWLLGQNSAHLAKREDKKTAIDQETGFRYVNDEITVKPELFLYPHEYIDAVIIHELIHNFFFDHCDDFQSTTDFYCEKILGMSEEKIQKRYSFWKCEPFAEHPLYNYKSSPRNIGPHSIIINGKRYVKKRRDTPPELVYFHFEESGE